ncbi:Type II/IV secretion system protein [uncultured archaeon]|nr:Type II/IV secretion system protein [uncultured archaeon]
MLETQIDTIIGLAQKSKGKSITFKEVSQKLKMPLQHVEGLARVLEKAGITESFYPINPFAQPGFKLVRELPPPVEPKMPKGKQIENYVIKDETNHSMAEVSLLEDEEEMRKMYFLKKSIISGYTQAYLDNLKDRVALELPPETSQMSDEERKKTVYKQQCDITEAHLREVEKDQKKITMMCGMIRSSMFGFGDIDLLLGDDWLEEIVINKSRMPVIIYHRKYGWMKTNLELENEDQISNYASQIARRIGKQISVLAPILDAHLLSGDRVNATMQPISVKGNTLTVRRFARNPWTIVHLVGKKFGSLTPEMAALLWQAMHYEMNLLVAGGTASGKTSMLNALSMFIPPYQRVISIEDTREITLSSLHWNWVPMVTRLPNPEGLGEVTMLDLMVNALRMRPDRIIVGEIRRSAEAQVLFEAMHTGHSVYSTLHADTGMQVMKRLVEPPIEVPPSEIDAINLVLVQYRDRRRNLRRTFEISEVVSTSGVPEVSKAYLWRARSDKFEVANPANKYVQSLNLHTGMTEKEIYEDQRKKADVLRWLDKFEYSDIEQVAKVIKHYYADEEVIYRAAEKGLAPDKVL